MSVLETLITDRVQGAKYSVQDVNRVCAAIKYVGDWLQALGLRISVSALKIYARDDLPTYSMFDDIVGQLADFSAAVRQRLPFDAIIPDCGTAQHYVTVYDANSIESIIGRLRDSAIELEGQRAWMLHTDPDTGVVTAYYKGETEPEIDFYINDDDQLVATWPEGTPEPTFIIDELGNISLVFLEGE